MLTRAILSSAVRRTSKLSYHGLSARVARPFCRCITQTRAASSASGPFVTDPTDAEAVKALEEGTRRLEDGDLEGATACYERSVQIRRTAHTLYNLGVIRYHAKNYEAAIQAWQESIDLEPSSPDAHTNLASAYIMSPVSRPDLALKHLRTAFSLSPDDPEISFNLAAVLEAAGHLEEALTYYKRSRDRGIERAAVNIRNVGAKILGQRLREEESESQSG